MKTKFNDLVGVHFHCFHPQRLWFGEQPLGTASAGYVSGYVSSCLRLTRNTVQKLQEVSSQVSYYYFVCHRGNLVFSNLCRFLESEVGDWLSDLDLLCLVWVIHFLYSIIGLRIRR